MKLMALWTRVITVTHCGRVGYGAVPMIIRSWVRVPAESVIVGALSKSNIYFIQLPLHTKEVSKGTSEGSDGTVD